MTIASIKEVLSEDNPDAYIYDGLDEAIIGLVHKDNGSILAYSFTACIGIFMERDSMSLEDALDYFYFNVAGLILGENQPMIVDDSILFLGEDNVSINDSS